MLSPALIFLVLIVGILIGSVGVGGVALVPLLKYLGDIPLHTAIPVCMFSYIFTGIVGAIIYARHGTINRSLGIRVCIGAIPGAYFGALLLSHVPGTALEWGIGVLILASGFYALRDNDDSAESRNTVSDATLVMIGSLVGVGSALSGTGGPLLLIPVLIWCKVPVLTAIGLAQVVQIPIALMATAGNMIHGDVDFKLGMILALVLSIGAVIGAKTAHLLPVQLLKKLVAGILVITGLFILYRLLFI